MRDPVRSAWIRCHLWCHHLLLVSLVGGASAVPAQTNGSPLPSSDPPSPVTITGQVINAASGLPVGRALVRLNDRAMLTTYEGKFEFDQVTDPTGLLQVTKPGFYSSIEPGGMSGTYIRANNATTLLLLRLYPEALFTGTVTAPDGDPLSHVLVSARRSTFNDASHTWIPVAQTQTDSHGRFRLTVPAGDYKLLSMYIPRINGTDKAVLPVSFPVETSSNTSNFLHIRSGEEQHYDLHPATSRTYAVTATFDSPLGRGFPRIVAHSSDGSTLTLPVRFSNREDESSIRMELPSGTYMLSASVRASDGLAEGETSVTVGDHDVTGVVFQLEPVPQLSVDLQVDGAATSDNSQPSLMQLGLMLDKSEVDPEDFNFSVPLMAQRGGTASFTASPGSYRLRARNDQGPWYIKSASYGISDLLQQDLVVAPGAGGAPIRITVSNQTASLQGVCTLGGVQAACWVYLIPKTPSATTVFTVRSNGQGNYNYAHLPPGSYEAIAFEQMYSANYANAGVLSPFATYVRAVTLNAGEKPTLNLDTVPEAEMAP